MIPLWGVGLVIPIKCISLYILSDSGEKKTPANYYHSVSAIAIGANYPHPMKTILNREKPPLKRCKCNNPSDIDSKYTEWTI